MSDTTAQPAFWRKCSSCKKPIEFGVRYWVCSVSTCNRARTGLVFCSVSCFDAHVPMMNHRDAGALEKRSPSYKEWQREQAEENAPPAERPQSHSQRPQGQPLPSAPSPALSASPLPKVPLPAAGGADVKREILVVVSKTKEYVRARAGINTSDAVMEALSDRIRAILDEAIRRAIQDERKTLLDRDLR